MAGISAGFELSRRGVDFRIFEANESIGGLCRSTEIDGYTFDVGGVHVMHSRHAEILRFMVETMGENLAITNRKAGIRQGSLTAQFPLASHLYSLPLNMRAASVGSLALTRAQMRLKNKSQATFMDWATFQFGSALAGIHYLPYAEKLWKLHPDEIVASFLSEIVPKPMLRSFFRFTSSGAPHQILHPVRGGIQLFVDRLAADLKENICLRTPVTAVSKIGKRFEVNGEEFDAIISTLPLLALVSCCDKLKMQVSESASRLAYRSLITLCVGARGTPCFEEAWVYSPQMSESPVHRISCMNTVGAKNDHDDKMSLIAEITFKPGDNLPLDPNVVPSALASLERLGLLTRNSIQFTEVFIHPYAYVLGDKYYKDSRSTVLSAIKEFGIHCVGRFGEHRQANMDEVIRTARVVCRDVCRSQ